MMQPRSVCRLCRSSENLVQMFDTRLESRNTDLLHLSIYLATGIDIREDDVVSKMVCQRCCEIVVKLHRYRTNAVATDKSLKEECGQPYVPPITEQNELRRVSSQILTSNGKVYSGQIGISTDGKLLLLESQNVAANAALDILNVSVKPEASNINSFASEVYKHDSIKNLYKIYSNIILPETVYKCDIAPVVTLDEREVEEWVEEEIKLAQEKLSRAKIIRQKVGDNTNDKDEDSPVNPLIYEASIQIKRPGPKSKTLVIPDNSHSVPLENLPKSRPGPKSKTLAMPPENSRSAPLEVLRRSRPGPMSRTLIMPESGQSVRYENSKARPGPQAKILLMPESSKSVQFDDFPRARPGPKSKTLLMPENNQSVPLNIFHKAKPGPKSKTLVVPENTQPVNDFSKVRPGPKSKTLVMPADHKPVFRHKTVTRPGPKSKTMISENITPIDNTPGPLAKSDINSVIYRPGPKSRKPDLIVNTSLTTKHVIHQDQPIKSVVTSTVQIKSAQFQYKPHIGSSTELEKSKTADTVVTEVPGNTVASFDDDDDDYDPGSSYFLESEEEVLNEPPKTRSSFKLTKKKSVKKRLLRSRKQSSTIDSNTYILDVHQEQKRQSSLKPDRHQSDTELQSPGLRKRSLSTDSNLDEPVHKKPAIRNENDNKLASKHKNNIHSCNKIKVDATRADSPKLDELKNSHKKHKTPKAAEGNIIEKHESSKSATSDKRIINEKLESSKSITSDKRKIVNEKQESSKSLTSDRRGLGNEKQEPSKSVMSDRKDHRGHKHRVSFKDTPGKVMVKSQRFYICKTCSKIFETSKELSEHQETHLICEFCNYRMKNVETLKYHKINNCQMNTQRDQQPMLKLTKVEAIRSIVTKYATAFGDDKTDSLTNVKKKFKKDDKKDVNKEVKKDINKDVNKDANKVVNNDVNKDANEDIRIPQGQPAIDEIPILSTIKSEVFLVSDDSDVEVEDMYQDLNILPKSFVDLPLSNLTEHDMIHALFTKHIKAAVSKSHRTAQTFVPQSTDVKYTNSHLIVIENLFNELYSYKVPVQLEVRPKISARFTGHIVPSPKLVLECWAHMKAVNVRKPVKLLNSASKPVRIAPAKFSSSPSLPKSKTAAVPTAATAKNTNALLLNNLLNTSPAIPSTPLFSLSSTLQAPSNLPLLQPATPFTSSSSLCSLLSPSSASLLPPSLNSLLSPYSTSLLPSSSTSLLPQFSTSISSPPTTQTPPLPLTSLPQSSTSLVPHSSASPPSSTSLLPPSNSSLPVSSTSVLPVLPTSMPQSSTSLLEPPTTSLLPSPITSQSSMSLPQLLTSLPILPITSSLPQSSTSLSKSSTSLPHPFTSLRPTSSRSLLPRPPTSSLPATSSSLLPPPSTLLSVSTLLQPQSSASLLPASSTSLFTQCSTSLLPPSQTLLTNSNIFLTNNNSFIQNMNGHEEPPGFPSLLTNSSAPTTNMTTTFIQTSNNGTLFMQNGVAANSTTIIQAPNNTTFIQTPNTAVIQTGNSTTFITPDPATRIAENSFLQTSSTLATNCVNTSNSSQNAVVLMQNLPQTTHEGIISTQTTFNPSGVLFQSPSEQIYQINNALTNANKVLVLSNTLSHGLQQNMPLYAMPSLSNLHAFTQQAPSSVSIEEIEENQDNGAVGGSDTTINQKSLIRIKPKPS